MKRSRALPIRLRLTVWYTLILAMLLVSFSVFVYLSLGRSLVAQVDTSLRLVASEAALSLQSENGVLHLGDPEEPTPLPALLASRGYALQVVTGTGEVVDGTGESGLLPQAPPAAGLATVVAGDEHWRVYTVALAAQETEGGPAFLEVAQSLAGVEAARDRLAQVLALGIPLALVLASGGGALLAGRALGPIDSITRQARRIGAEVAQRRTEALGHRLEMPLPQDEVGRLARTFDEMLARLEEAFHRERQFTSDAAHELRTPLTALKGAIDVALRRQRTTREYREVLGGLGREVDRLTDLSHDLLVLARAENGGAGGKEQGREAPARPWARDVRLAETAGLVVDRLRPLAEAKRVDLHFSFEGDPAVAGDAAQLGRAITNLVDNAVKSTAAGGQVTVSCREAPGEGAVLVEVADTGCGISAEDLPRVFDRFYRADRARRREEAPAGIAAPPSGGGAGLGLTIARAVARGHGGDITVASALGRGSVFTLRLPKGR